MANQKHQEYQYLDLLKEALEHGERKVDRGTDIKLYSLFGRQTRYDLSEGFPLLTTKKVYWKGVIHELAWFMSGDTNIKYLVDNNVHIWDDYPYKIFKTKNAKSKFTKDEFIEKIREDAKFAKKWGDLPRIYGEMWRKWPTHSASSGRAKKPRTIDQLAWVMQELKEDPDAKNAIVTSWNPEYMYTMALKKEANRFPICHNMYQVSRRGNKLSLQLYQRSADLFLGVPFNIASYSLLIIILANIMDLEPGEFIHTFGDAHIYENHIPQVKEQLTRVPRPFPKIKINRKIKSIDDFKAEDIELLEYDPYPAMKAELTVAGGLYDKKTGKMAG
ncbi:MAG: thymidylate synthase [Candidatus Levybacteria bacterium]|nr:thymidylate synthase [Candidatus Levybacteria bacterium]MBP9815036.1 thymidylate synthase [Candidatus Levybacteria bacterium]